MEVSVKRKATSDADDRLKRQKVDDDVLRLAPREVSVVEYAESHATEIKLLTEKLKVEPCGKLISQKLPRHMRRRAMAHNMKRLPRSVRNMYTNIPPATESKRPSRKHRRRPKHLLSEYVRRQRTHIWLETHIWHAKRFHMVEKWGFKIPWKATQKNERACYRATSRHCLIQDMSYMCCIEIVGDLDSLLDSLKHITHPDTGMTFASVQCLGGVREGHTTLYHYDSYPWNAIGPVTFMWNPSTPITAHLTTTSQKQLWIWCHPACWQEVWTELKKCLNLVETDVRETTEDVIDGENNNLKYSSNLDIDTITESKVKTVEASFQGKKNKPNKQKRNSGKGKGPQVDSNKIAGQAKKEPCNSQATLAVDDTFKTDVIAVNRDTKVEMKSLAGSLVRFRLTGPESNAILCDTLQEASVAGEQPPEDEKEKTEGGTHQWWTGYYGNSKHSAQLTAQREFMKSVGQCLSPAELAPHSIFAMTTGDPRLTRPVRRTKVQAADTNIFQNVSSHRHKVDGDICSSPMWRDDVRKQVISDKPSDHQIHLLKSQQLVPGLPLKESEDDTRVPAIVIQRPGVSSLVNNSHNAPKLGLGAGFDVILPRGWAMPFWLALVYRGARCAGLRDLNTVAFEERSLLFPGHYPDSMSGVRYSTDREMELIDKYNKVPPAKRHNYTKLQVNSPFWSPWKQLVSKHSPYKLEQVKPSDHGVSDNRNERQCVQSAQNLANEKSFFVLRSSKCLKRLHKLCSETKPAENGTVQLSLPECSIDDRELDLALVPVTVTLTHRGCPAEFSHICLPVTDDLNKLDADPKYGGPFQTQQVDPVAVERSRLKTELKKKGITKKVKVDRSLKPVSGQSGIDINNESRQVMGYLTSGGFDLGIGNGAGVGFVCLPGLRKLLQGPRCKQGLLVLVRSTGSLQYRFARLSIIV